MVRDVLMKDPTASSLIGGRYTSTSEINVLRFKHSLDDNKLLFWRPGFIQGGEWPYIFLLKLSEGKLVANKELGASV